jgi:cysteine desulfurase
VGAGALFVRRGVRIAPLLHGGRQERRLRPGTENVPAIVGFGLACEIAVAGLADSATHVAALRDELERGLVVLGAAIFGAAAPRLPNTVYFALPAIDGETLVGKLDRAGYALASGAACSSANPEASHVLLAMGVDAGLARGAVRVSLGAATTAADVRGFLAALAETARQLNRMSALVH